MRTGSEDHWITKQHTTLGEISVFKFAGVLVSKDRLVWECRPNGGGTARWVAVSHCFPTARERNAALCRTLKTFKAAIDRRINELVRENSKDA